MFYQPLLESLPCVDCERAQWERNGGCSEECLHPLIGSPRAIERAVPRRSAWVITLLKKLATEDLDWVFDHIAYRYLRHNEVEPILEAITDAHQVILRQRAIPALYEWANSRWTAKSWMTDESRSEFMIAVCAEYIAEEVFAEAVFLVTGKDKNEALHKGKAIVQQIQNDQARTKEEKETRRSEAKLAALVPLDNPSTHQIADIAPARDGIEVAYHDDSQLVRQIQEKFGFVWESPFWLNRGADKEKKARACALRLMQEGIAVRVYDTTLRDLVIQDWAQWQEDQQRQSKMTA